MTNKTTYHTTEVAKVLFMAAARPMKDKVTGKEKFSIKIELPEESETVKHLLSVSEAKVDTKNNRKLVGIKHINFDSDFAPKVELEDGTKLEGKQVPFFDGRIDKAQAVVTYKIIKYSNRDIVRLHGIKIISIEKAPREGEEFVTSSDILEQLNSI